MPLKPNSQAPDFTLPASTGGDFTLSKHLAGTPCVLYFYPKDFTAGCTAEACNFRDHFEEFRNLDIDVIGISRDKVATHQRFIKEYGLPFVLLADEQGTVSRRYEAVVPILGMAKRVTYLLDAQHRIAAVYDSLLDSSGHIRAMLAHLKKSPKL